MSPTARVVTLVLGAIVVSLGLTACGDTASSVSAPEGDTPLATGLARLPGRVELRKQVLAGDLDRLRHAYPDPKAYEAALESVWLPDALIGARQPLWRRAYGLDVRSVSSFAAAGFHPAVVAVAEGSFSRSRIRRALERKGYRLRGDLYAYGDDGEIDPTTPEGRLALAALNRIHVTGSRLTAASTSALARAAEAPSSALADDTAFGALAAPLDPITSAIVLDAKLVRPPSGVPTPILPRHAAVLVGVGIDDRGPTERTLKIVLAYDEAAQAEEDAELIDRALASTQLPGLPRTRFSDLSREWEVSVSGSAVLITTSLPPSTPTLVWRELVERGDLGPLVRPALTP